MNIHDMTVSPVSGVWDRDDNFLGFASRGRFVGRLAPPPYASACEFMHDVTLSDGVPVSADTGQTLRYVGAANVIRSGDALTIDAGSGQRAGYIEAELPEPCTRMGAEFSFTGGSGGNGRVCLIPWVFSNDFPPVPPTGMHFTLSVDGWQIDWFDQDVTNFATISSGHFATKLAADTWHTIEWVRDGETVAIRMPDGQVVNVTHEKIGAYAGRFACFEIYQGNGAVDSFGKFRRIWASSRNQYPLREPRMPKEVANAQLPTAVAEVHALGSTAIPTALGPVDATNLKVKVVKGPKGKTLVRWSGWVNSVPAGATLVLGVRFVDDTGATLRDDTFYGAPGSFSGRVAFDALIDVPWLTRVSIVMTHFCTAAGATWRLDTSSQLLLSATPI